MTTAIAPTRAPDKTYSGIMSELNENGDTKVTWSADNAAEVEVARNAFTKLLAKGFKAFTVKRNGEAGDEIKTFDPEAERIILVP